MANGPVPDKKKLSVRRWISFFMACVIFTVLWLSTGDSSNILDMPWWSFVAVLIIQAILMTVWGRLRPLTPR